MSWLWSEDRLPLRVLHVCIQTSQRNSGVVRPRLPHWSLKRRMSHGFPERSLYCRLEIKCKLPQLCSLTVSSLPILDWFWMLCLSLFASLLNCIALVVLTIGVPKAFRFCWGLVLWWFVGFLLPSWGLGGTLLLFCRGGRFELAPDPPVNAPEKSITTPPDLFSSILGCSFLALNLFWSEGVFLPLLAKVPPPVVPEKSPHLILHFSSSVGIWCIQSFIDPFKYLSFLGNLKQCANPI